MFYDEFIEQCNRKGVSRSKACIDCNISRTAWNKWINGAIPNGATISKLAEYFGVSVAKLLGEAETEKAPAPEDERKANIEDVKIALFGGDGEVTDEMWEEALFAAEMIKERYRRKKGQND